VPTPASSIPPTPTATAAFAETVDSAEPQPLRILLAEDNRVNRVVSLRLLENLGHQVTWVENGRDAVERSKSEEFDLVLMDLQMPEMDGLAATEAIREWEKPLQRHLPIVAMTAHAMKGDEQRCLASGMDGYVTKPIQRSELYRTLSLFRRAPAAAAPQTAVPRVGAAP
jgi:CheY-like chemotaxis protein